MRYTFYLVFTFLFPSFTAHSQTIRYVDQNVAGGLGTGTSWANAFPTLQQALAVSQTGDAIWVAAGVYKPTNGVNRTVSFNLVDGVQLYGGFTGLETALEQRNPEVNETILSGDIGMPNINTDNSYHVIHGKGLGGSTVLDGFIVTDGYSYGEFTSDPLDGLGAGILLEGAPSVTNSRPYINHCRFERNFAYLGGALCTTWEDPDDPGQGKNLVNPVLVNCEFNNNRAYLYGGAIYLNSPSGANDTFTLERCTISDNYVYGGDGGGIYFNQTAFSNTRMTACVFERDTSLGGVAGAIYYQALPPAMNTTSLVLDSCVFRKNVSPEGTGLFYNGLLDPSIPGVQFNCRITQCLFEGNKAKNSDGSAYLMITSFGGKITAEVTDCIFRDNLSGNYTTSIGAIYSSEIDVHLERCIFINNHDRDSPDQICMAVHSGTSGGSAVNKATTRINNCLFAGNGGGVAVQSGLKNYVATNVTNCTFYDNNEYIFIHTWDTLYNQPNGFHNDLFIDNCIVWEPGTDMVKMFYNNDPDNFSMYGYHINHTLLNLTDSVGVPGSLEAFGDGLIFGQYPVFEDTAAGNFRLALCSPAINKGNNLSALNAGLMVDLDSLTRIRYSIVDMGTYEQQDSCDMVATSDLNTPSGLHLWPNPSLSGILQFQTTEGTDSDGRLLIFNASGQLIHSRNTTILFDNIYDLRYLPPGLYQIRVETPAEVFAGKWIRL